MPMEWAKLLAGDRYKDYDLDYDKYTLGDLSFLRRTGVANVQDNNTE